MALSLFTKNMSIIALLPDEPNDVGGLSAEQLKEKFDEGGVALKEYLNKTLIPEVEAAIEAAALGVPSGGGIDGRIITDGSLTSGKYAAGSVNVAAIADGAVTEGKIADSAVTGSKVSKGSIGREHLTEDAIMLQSTDFPNKVVPGRALADETIEGTKIAPKAVSGNLIADKAVTADKLADDAKSKGVAVVLAKASWASNSQTVNVEGVTAGNNVLVAAAPASRTAWNDAEVYCSGQGEGTLTFACSSTPSADVTANVVILV